MTKLGCKPDCILCAMLGKAPIFRHGDIVEVAFPETYHESQRWNGLQFKLLNKAGSHLTGWMGTITKSILSVGYLVGDDITWGDPEHLKLVNPSGEKAACKQADSYLSPFSGKWV
jgi:hypothetical protein